MYDMTTMQTDFVVKLSAISKWLKANKYTLATTLKDSYVEDVDYQRVSIPKSKDVKYGNNRKEYYLSPDCFKRLCMMSRSKNAEMVRTYFLAVEKAFYQYRNETEEGMRQTIQRLERNQKGPEKNDIPGVVYIKRASHHDRNLLKIGRTGSLRDRVRTYSTGEADDVEILYQYKTDYVKSVEKCVKAWLEDKRYRRYKEVYDVTPDVAKRFIESCGEIGLKLMHKKRNSTLKGGYFIVFEKEETN
jgi:phage anti-repressor protein